MKIYITVKGGMVQSVHTDAENADVVIIDKDLDGASEERVEEVDSLQSDLDADLTKGVVKEVY